MLLYPRYEFKGIRMTSSWEKYRDTKCYPVEKDLLGFNFDNPNLLIRALTRSAVFNQTGYLPEHKENGHQIGLDTIGDTVLDFAIFSHFIEPILSEQVKEKKKSREIIHGYRKWYGMNDVVQEFSKNCIHLNQYIIWGPDEEKRKIWDQKTTKNLADCFEAIIGAVYKDHGMKGVEKMLQKIDYYSEIDIIRLKQGKSKTEYHIP
jgi:ribonuclease III